MTFNTPWIRIKRAKLTSRWHRNWALRLSKQSLEVNWGLGWWLDLLWQQDTTCGVGGPENPALWLNHLCLLPIVKMCHYASQSRLTSDHCTIGKGSLKVGIRDSLTLPLILYTSKYFRNVYQLSASFYQHPNIPDTFFGDEMHCSSLELGK